MTDETTPKTEQEPEAKPAAKQAKPDPDEKIIVRWDGPTRVFPDYVRAIRSHHPDRRPAAVKRGDILQIRRRERGPYHADTTSKADPINVTQEK